MVNSPDYRIYLESNFKSIHDTLDRIEAQTTKTNGNVTALTGRVTIIESDMKTHPFNCASSQKIEKIGEDLEEYRIIKKYPKIAIYIVAFFVIAFLFVIYKSYNIKDQLENKMDEQTQVINRNIDQQEGVSKVTRGGYVKYNESGVSDSIKIK